MSHFYRVAAAALLSSTAAAQGGSVSGQVVLADGGAPLGFTTVALLSQPTQLLTNESGAFTINGVMSGPVRLRFKRIGFAPKDTSFTVADNEAVRIRVEMTRLVIRLPEVVVSGRCTDRTPFESKPAELAELFDQVSQNAERMKLLAESRPFLIQLVRTRGNRHKDNKLAVMYRDTVTRRPMPPEPYQPKKVIVPGTGIDAGRWLVALPEAPDIADTAFTNNHCFSYAGLTRFEDDSVIAVAFEPVPWLNKEVDIKGTLYLKVDGYQLVGSVTMLNRIPAQFRRGGLEDYVVRARFAEIVDGVPVLDRWELSNKYRSARLPFVEIGQVFNVQWMPSDSGASTPAKVP